MSNSQLEAVAKAAQAIGLQLNGLLSIHQKSATSYSLMVTSLGNGDLILEPKIEKKALKQMERNIKMTENGIKKLSKIDALIAELESMRMEAGKEVAQ